MKTFYSEYAQHSMRFYAKYPNKKEFCSELDKENWFACQNALKDFDEHNKELLLSIYSSGKSLAAAVEEVSAQNDVNDGELWTLVKKFEHRFAKRRGLI